MVEDQERRQAVDALLIRLREETESAVRGFVDDVVTRADADRQRALDEARRAADAAVAAARTNARAAAEEVVAVQLKEAEARHVARVAELEEKLARTREELGAERAAAVAETRKQAKEERAAAVAEVREEAAAEQAAAVAEVRKRAEAEQAAAVAEVRERAEAERAEAVAELREQAEAQQAVAVARLRTDAAAEQAAALSRARTEAAVEQAAAVSRVRKEAAAAQQEAVAQAQEAGTQAALAANATGGVSLDAAAAGPGVSAGPEDEVRLALDYGHPGAGPGAAVGDAADDAARVSQVLDSIRYLDEQTTLTAVLDTLTDAAADYASRAALFVRVDGEMRAWRLSGFDPEVGEAGDPVLNGDGSGFLGRAIAEGRALVLTPPPGEDELDWPPAFAGLPPDRSAIAVPVSIGGQSMVALYADDAHRESQSAPAEWSDAIELLARHAGCCIEALTANQAAGAARPAPAAAEPNPAGSPPDGAFGRRPSPAG